MVLEVALNKIYRLVINAIIRKIVKEERLSITRTKDNFNYNSFKLPSNSKFCKNDTSEKASVRPNIFKLPLTSTFLLKEASLFA